MQRDLAGVKSSGWHQRAVSIGRLRGGVGGVTSRQERSIISWVGNTLSKKVQQGLRVSVHDVHRLEMKSSATAQPVILRLQLTAASDAGFGALVLMIGTHAVAVSQ